MRLALTRVRTVESVESARSGVNKRIDMLPSPETALKYAAMAGAGVFLSRSFLRAAKGKAAPIAAAAPARVPNPWSGLAVQVISIMLLPVLQKIMAGEKPAVKLPTMPQLPSMPEIPTPSDMFFRWLGLQK